MSKSNICYYLGMFFLYASLPFVFMMPEHFPSVVLGITFTRVGYMEVTLGLMGLSMVFAPPYLFFSVKEIRERKARRGIL